MNKLFEAVKVLGIVDVIERFTDTKLSMSGNSMKGICPLHNEKTPSFSVLPDKGTFKCFGCGAGGDSINFVAMLKGYESQKTAAVEIARSFGLEVDNDKYDDIHLSKKAIHICNESAAQEYSKSLLDLTGESGKIIKGYVAERLGLKNRNKILAVISEWGIGWCGAGSNDFIANEPMAEKSGLLSDTKKQVFANRIVVPIKNKQGEVCGFGGRILPNCQNDYTPKYLNTKENIVFKKQNLLFGLHESLRKTKNKMPWILTESYFDVINLHARGVSAAVANMGTALSLEQAKLLVSTFKVEAILIIAHNDKNFAGLKSAISSYEILLAQGLNVEICIPLQYKDIGEIVESQNIDNWVQLQKHLKAYSYQECLEKIGVITVEDKIDKSLWVAKSIKNPIAQDDFLEDLSIKFGKSKNLLRKQMNFL
jgi:DNA primase